MSRTANPGMSFQECCQAFAASYELSTTPAMREIEKSVLGCDYGGTSWTTQAQAVEIIDGLGLTAGVNMLEIGAGSGWPGLFLAEQSGCGVTLLDLPVSALSTAMQRATDEGNGEKVVAVSASGDALPFHDRSFDAIGHSDVLCCLPGKQRMLEECRRVSVEGARMLFSVISVAEDLPESDRKAAFEIGPPFVDSEAPYSRMLPASGWHLGRVQDVTREYAGSLRTLVRELGRSSAIAETLGADVVEESIVYRNQQIDAIERGWLVRETFLATAR